MTVGSAIAYAFGRTPLVLAAEARDLDALSCGRLILGLGTGTKKMQRDWHGLDGEHPAPRMEELVPLIRRLLRLNEGKLDHEGRFYRAIVHPTVPVEPPLRADLPIYMAGVNARMIEAAGAVADGLVGHPLFTPEYTREVVRPALARGAERAGRDAPPPIAGYVTCCVDEDGDAARSIARGVVAFNSTVSTYRPILTLHGFDAAGRPYPRGLGAARLRGDGVAKSPTRCSRRSRSPVRPTRSARSTPSAAAGSSSARCCGRRSAASTRCAP